MTLRTACAIAASLALGVWTVPVVGQVPRFRSGRDAVNVDVGVTRRGRPVTGLTAANFELRDSGRLQRVEVVVAEDVPLHLLLALDTSQSVSGEELASLKNATLDALGGLRDDDRVTLLTFSHQLRLAEEVDRDRDAVRGAVSATQGRGSTSLHDALLNAFVLRDDDARRPLLLVFSDGEDTASWVRADRVLEEASRTDVVCYAVVPRLEEVYGRPAYLPLPTAPERLAFERDPQLARKALLAFVVEDTGGRLFYTDMGTDLRQAFLDILREFRSRYILTYAPEDVPAGGWHPIEVKLKGARGDVKARRGYLR